MKLSAARKARLKRDDTYLRDYARGWRTSATSSDGALERADMRGEPRAWEDGYYDHAAGRAKWHTAHCGPNDHDTCPDD